MASHGLNVSYVFKKDVDVKGISERFIKTLTKSLYPEFKDIDKLSIDNLKEKFDYDTLDVIENGICAGIEHVNHYNTLSLIALDEFFDMIETVEFWASNSISSEIDAWVYSCEPKYVKRIFKQEIPENANYGYYGSLRSSKYFEDSWDCIDDLFEFLKGKKSKSKWTIDVVKKYAPHEDSGCGLFIKFNDKGVKKYKDDSIQELANSIIERCEIQGSKFNIVKDKVNSTLSLEFSKVPQPFSLNNFSGFSFVDYKNLEGIAIVKNLSGKDNWGGDLNTCDVVKGVVCTRIDKNALKWLNPSSTTDYEYTTIHVDYDYAESLVTKLSKDKKLSEIQIREKVADLLTKELIKSYETKKLNKKIFYTSTSF